MRDVARHSAVIRDQPNAPAAHQAHLLLQQDFKTGFYPFHKYTSSGIRLGLGTESPCLRDSKCVDVSRCNLV